MLHRAACAGVARRCDDDCVGENMHDYLSTVSASDGWQRNDALACEVTRLEDGVSSLPNRPFLSERGGHPMGTGLGWWAGAGTRDRRGPGRWWPGLVGRTPEFLHHVNSLIRTEPCERFVFSLLLETITRFGNRPCGTNRYYTGRYLDAGLSRSSWR